MELIQDTINRYKKLYGEDPEYIVTAPARVNLIGEHTDYNNGYVLPVTIDRKIILAAGKRKDEVLNLHSVDFQSSFSVSLSDLAYDEKRLWTNYPKGIAYIFREHGYEVKGANFCFRGDIPIGAGLSSSAAIEVASGIAFKLLNKLEISLLDLIQLTQKAEAQFVGVQCGIMDQFASFVGKRKHTLFLDCNSLQYEYLPCPKEVKLIVADAGIRRELAHTAYNLRQAECEDALRYFIDKKPSIKTLRDVSVNEFKEMEKGLPVIARKRAWHVISENDRVLKSVDAIKINDMKEFGKLMIESHMSLRDNYEVSCRELDAFVDIAVESDGVFGARMTGAGFGGSGICIIDKDKIDKLVDHLRTEFPKRAGRSLTIYVVATDDGAAVINPKESLEPKRFLDLL